uniref:Elongation of very long chain fatty acids protein n=1 Tax=Glossina brevipalpis TaxID=37001 RepID=A0A1A9W5Z7_9MUSC
MGNNSTYFATLIYKSAGVDSKIDEWLLMSSPGYMLILLLLYLVFVLFIGPRLMENRKAFLLRRTLQVYNTFQILYNLFMIITLSFKKTYIIEKLISNNCQVHRTPDELLDSSVCGWYYLLSKIIDLLDTIFIVLRKKQSQVSFLHVYHHSIMVITSWTILKYVPMTEEFAFGYLLNNMVHVMMYFYYLVAAMGPQYQKLLWWKKYMTRIQLGQFVFILLYLAAMVMKGCELSQGVKLGLILNASVFLLLFADFYRKTYANKAVQKNVSTEKSKQDRVNKYAMI